MSVVIPAYNAAACIGQTICSVLAQTTPPDEIVVVDDGSSDGTAEVARACGDQVRVVAQHNQGVGTARNTGVSAARGDFIAFVDADDLWHPDKLRAQLAAIERDPDLGVVYGEFQVWDPATPAAFPTEVIDEAAIVPRLSGWIYHHLLLTNWVMTSTSLTRRWVFERTGPFDTGLRLGEDWDFFLRAARHARFLKLRDVVTLYRQHPGQTTKQALSENYEALVLDRAVAAFGFEGPNGERPDMGDFRRRRFRGHVSHGVRHLESGDPAVAFASFVKALRLRPTAPLPFGYAAISLAKLIFARGHRRNT